MPFLLDWKIVLLAFGFSALVGVIFGYFPARRGAPPTSIRSKRCGTSETLGTSRHWCSFRHPGELAHSIHVLADQAQCLTNFVTKMSPADKPGSHLAVLNRHAQRTTLLPRNNGGSMKTKALVIGGISAAVVLASGSAFAQATGHGPGGFGPPFMQGEGPGAWGRPCIAKWVTECTAKWGQACTA